MNKSIFAERLRSIMDASSIKQNELAKRARITEAALSRYLNDGRIPRMEVVANLATALNTTTDYLLGLVKRSEEDWEYCGIKRLVARGSATMTKEQKMELIDILFGKGE